MPVVAELPPEAWLFTGDPGPCPLPVADPADCCGCACGSYLDDVPPAPSEPVGWAVPGVPRPSPVSSPVRSGLLDGLDRALDAVAAHGPLSGSRADTAGLLRLAERARGLALRELAEMDTVGGHLLPGQTNGTTATWLRDEQRLTDPAARATVHLACQLREHLPALGALLQTGGTTLEHAAAVTGGVRGLDPVQVRNAEPGLCALAQATDPGQVRRRLRDLACAIDDRLAADAARRAHDRMGLRLSQVGGHTAIDGTLAGDTGATIRLAMDLAVEAARTAGDTRSTPARRADVLLDWATHYLTRAHGPGDTLAHDTHTVRSHLLLTCTPAQLAAAAPDHQPGPDTPDLAALLHTAPADQRPASASIVGDHNPLSRAALRRLACDTTISLIALPPAGTGPTDPLYVGRSTRTVTGTQFTALVVRDRTCIVRGCHRPPAQCAAHHVQHWADGGNTDLDNLVLLCHQHHHDHHDRGHDLPHHDNQRRITQTGWAQAPP